VRDRRLIERLAGLPGAQALIVGVNLDADVAGIGWDHNIQHLLPVPFEHKMSTWLADRWNP